MSYTEIYKVDNAGEVVGYEDVRNAWHGAMHIWTKMGEKHVGNVSFFDENGMKKVWALAKQDIVPLHERIVLASTFDNVIVRKEFLPTLIAAFKRFTEENPTGNLSQQIDHFEALLADDDSQGVCWNQTSVNSNPWADYDEEQDEDKPYNINNGDRHWFLDESFPNVTEESVKG